MQKGLFLEANQSREANIRQYSKRASLPSWNKLERYLSGGTLIGSLAFSLIIFLRNK